MEGTGGRNCSESADVELFARSLAAVLVKNQSIWIQLCRSITLNFGHTHWQDTLQVVLSVQTGKISSATLLRKLGNYSRKNRLYQAFQELGRVIRTVFLLQYISSMQLRKEITATGI